MTAKRRGIRREKICKLKAGDKSYDLLFFCEGARDTEDRMFDKDSGTSMHNAEERRIKFSYNGYFEKAQSKPICDLPRPGASANK